MERTRERLLSTSDAVIVFARQGLALETLARALVIPVEQAQRICSRAVEAGELQMIPPRQPSDVRTGMLVECVNLRAQLSDAQAVIRELRKVPDGAEAFHRVAGLTTSEATIVAALCKFGRLSKARIYNALYGLDPDGGPEPKIIDVLMCKLRKKLKPHGITVDTLWGNGYAMTPDAVARMRTLAGEPVPLPIIPSPSLAANVNEMVAS